MNIAILGPQGSGKGTQAELLKKEFGMHHIEMGEILRSIAETKNKYADEVRRDMNKGDLVPDELVRLIVWDHINKQDKNKGWLFDGYPRSLLQYEQLEDMLMKFSKKIDRVIFIQISEEESVKRLSARRTCEKCGEIYNLLTKPPKNESVCDKCGGKLTQREDDTPEAIKRRLELFNQKTSPIKEKAGGEGILIEVDGERPIEVIHADIMKRLENHA